MLTRILFTLLVLLSATLYAEEASAPSGVPGASVDLSPDHKVAILELKNRMLEADAKYARVQAKINACDSDSMAMLNGQVTELQRVYQADEKAIRDLKAKVEAEHSGYRLDLVTLKLIKLPTPKE